jgi:hypothetical protein
VRYFGGLTTIEHLKFPLCRLFLFLLEIGRLPGSPDSFTKQYLCFLPVFQLLPPLLFPGKNLPGPPPPFFGDRSVRKPSQKNNKDNDGYVKEISKYGDESLFAAKEMQRRMKIEVQ